eukprot:8531496-Ditylum_brightwellii.AAC.1
MNYSKDCAESESGMIVDASENNEDENNHDENDMSQCRSRDSASPDNENNTEVVKNSESLVGNSYSIENDKEHSKKGGENASPQNKSPTLSKDLLTLNDQQLQNNYKDGGRTLLLSRMSYNMQEEEEDDK